MWTPLHELILGIDDQCWSNIRADLSHGLINSSGLKFEVGQAKMGINDHARVVQRVRARAAAGESGGLPAK